MYAVQQDLIDRYGEDALLEVADSDFDGLVDAEVVAVALADASDEIDVYVGSRYQLPLIPVPPLLKRLAVDIALYKLSTAGALTDEKRQRYEDALRLLRDIAAGRASLGIEVPAPTRSGSVELSGPGRQFNRSNLNRLT